MRYEYKDPRLERERDAVLTELLSRRGMVTYLAKQLGITKAAVAQWYSIPDMHIASISKLLDIPQYQLRQQPRRPKVAA